MYVRPLAVASNQAVGMSLRSARHGISSVQDSPPLASVLNQTTLYSVSQTRSFTTESNIITAFYKQHLSSSFRFPFRLFLPIFSIYFLSAPTQIRWFHHSDSLWRGRIVSFLRGHSVFLLTSYFIDGNTVIRRLTTAIRSEICFVKQFRRCANAYLHKPR